MINVALSRDAGGSATLQVSGLAAAPNGKTYEAWVIPKGKAPRPAGLFSGGATTTIHLKRAVPNGALVAVTIERAGGVPAPTTTPILSARA